MKRTTAVLVLVLATSAAAAQTCPNIENAQQPQFLRPVDGVIVSGFGMRNHPILHTTRMHTGVDYGLALGEPVRAAASGKVLFAGREPEYGNFVALQHGSTYETTYAHLSAIDVQQGGCVQAGEIIGKSGTTSIGPRLYFEVRISGRFVDPTRYVADNRPQQ